MLTGTESSECPKGRKVLCSFRLLLEFLGLCSCHSNLGFSGDFSSASKFLLFSSFVCVYIHAHTCIYVHTEARSEPWILALGTIYLILSFIINSCYGCGICVYVVCLWVWVCLCACTHECVLTGIRGSLWCVVQLLSIVFS